MGRVLLHIQNLRVIEDGKCQQYLVRCIKTITLSSQQGHQRPGVLWSFYSALHIKDPLPLIEKIRVVINFSSVRYGHPIVWRSRDGDPDGSPWGESA